MWAWQVDWEAGQITVLPAPIIELAYPFTVSSFKGDCYGNQETVSAEFWLNLEVPTLSLQLLDSQPKTFETFKKIGSWDMGLFKSNIFEKNIVLSFYADGFKIVSWSIEFYLFQAVLQKTYLIYLEIQILLENASKIYRI